jgi:hypothetical protein
MLTIDSTYFWGTLQLHFADFSEPDGSEGLAAAVATTTRQKEVDLYISKYERKACELIMGKGIADEYLKWKGSTEEEPYEGDIPTSVLEALDATLIDTESKTSPIANYIWLIVTEDTINTETARGAVVEKIGEGKRVSNSTKAVRVWNEFVEGAIKVREFIHETEELDEIKTRPERLTFANRFWI